MMNKQQLVLALLTCSGGAPFTPVQLQKAAFLVCREAPDALDEPRFHFEPYDYGPFDSDVYAEAQSLAGTGDATVSPSPFGRWNMYAATEAGLVEGKKILERLSDRNRKYVGEVADWVRRQSFSSLVKAIYKAYPDTKVNSVFRG
jgi:uncharacterized protein